MKWMNLIERDGRCGDVLTQEEVNDLYAGKWLVIINDKESNRIIATSLSEDMANQMKNMYIESNIFSDIIKVKYIDGK